MKIPENDPMERMLREHFDGPVADEGFSAQVMRQLPVRRRFHGWVTIVGLLVGALACGVCLATAPLPRMGWHDWLAGQVSASALVLMVVVAGISLLGMAWVLAEGDDPLENVL